MSRRILVTGASGDIGEAVGRVLAEIGVEAHGADAGDPFPGRLVYPVVHKTPLSSDPAYLNHVAELVRRFGYDLVLPLTEPELSTFAGSASWPPLLWVGPGLVRAFLDKLATADWLAEHRLPAPWTLPIQRLGPADLPLVAKPRQGWGGRGVTRVESTSALRALQAHAEAEGAEYVGQQLLLPDDAELTCAVVRLHGVVRTLQLRRTLVGGLTGRGEVVQDTATERVLHDLSVAADLEGCLNVQLRLTEEGPRIFEVNPRLSSTVMMRHRLGFEDLRWWLETEGPEELPPFAPPVGTRVFRLAREVVVRP